MMTSVHEQVSEPSSAKQWYPFGGAFDNDGVKTFSAQKFKSIIAPGQKSMKLFAVPLHIRIRSFASLIRCSHASIHLQADIHLHAHTHTVMVGLFLPLQFRPFSLISSDQVLAHPFPFTPIHCDCSHIRCHYVHCHHYLQVTTCLSHLWRNCLSIFVYFHHPHSLPFTVSHAKWSDKNKRHMTQFIHVRS